MGDHRWDGVTALHYSSRSVDLENWTVSLRYELAGAQPPLRFTETVAFPAPVRPPPGPALEVFRRVLELLQVAAGTSYYKLAAPREVQLDAVGLAGPAMDWASALYRDGLAEFAYTNDLPQVREVALTGGSEPESLPLAAAEGPPLVPVGGGKDSLVTVEAVRTMAPTLFVVNPNPVTTSVLDATGLPWLAARRTIDPQVFALNRAGAYNGHVPVTAINSLVAVATAVLHGLGPVVMSNEWSASVPNLDWHGQPVNHQWSKGIDAERLLRAALAAQAGLTEAYFSLLRPLSELHIAKLYARLDGYDAVMTSCNAAFRLVDRTARWCGDCPKCRFVFLALAPFLPRQRLVGIFGKDLLADEKQLPGFRELAGITRHKPFECVGEPAESLAALRFVSEQDEWAGAAVLRQLRAEVAHPTWLPDAELAEVFGTDGPSFAPQQYARALHELIGAADAAG